MSKRLFAFIFFFLIFGTVVSAQTISRNDSLRQVFEDKNDKYLNELTVKTTISTQLQTKAQKRLDSLVQIRNNKELSPKLRIKAQDKILSAVLYRDTKNSLPEIKIFLEISLQFRDSIQTLGLAYGYFGYYYTHQERYDSAEYFYQQALLYASKKQKMGSVLTARIDLALLDEKQGNYDQALKQYLDILDSCVFYKKTYQEARSRLNIGGLYHLKGDYAKSLEYLQEALDICIIRDLDGYMASTYIALGDVNQAIGENTLAEDYYIKALKWADVMKNTNNKRNTLFQYIQLKAAVKNYREALSLAHRLLFFEKKHGNLNRLGQIFYLMADLYFENKQIDSAQYYIQQSLDLYKGFANAEKAYKAYSIAGKIALHVGSIANAESFCKKSYELNDSKGDIECQKDNSYCLYQIYKQKNNSNLALRYFEEYNALINKIEDKEEAKKIVKIQLNNQFKNKIFRDSLQNLKEKELLELQHTQKLERRTRLALGLFIGLGILIFVTVILWYAFRKNKKQKEELDALNRLNKQIFSIISHDLRSPMMAMNLMVETLGDADLDEERLRFYLKDIKNQISQTSNILENLLNWAKAELQIDIPQDFKTNIYQIVTELEPHFASKLKEKQLEFINEIPKDATLSIHPDLLKIVLRNLLGNAIKYSHPIEEIVLSYSADLKQIVIKDTGVGMDENQVENLFQQPVFSQLGTEQETGFGIGLYITYQLLKKIGWNITVQSEKGKGTIFFVNAKK